MDLTKKYRPRRFADVHQPHVTRILAAQIENGDTEPCYLMSGPSGTGKTTMARVMAMALCDPDRPAGQAEPTDSAAVRRILDGTHPDVVEINCADQNGVDDVREGIIDNLRIMPKNGPFRVYVLDEAHMLTTAAQNALLKPTEEPPSYVRFLLCSTDPHKIIGTIRSRCQVHTLRLVGDEPMTGILTDVLGKEGIAYEPAALELIVQEAAGGVRAAIKLVEKVAPVGVTEANVRETIGRGPRSLAAAMLLAAAQGDRAGVLQAIEATQSGGFSLLGLLEDGARTAMAAAKARATKAPPTDALTRSVSDGLTGGQAIVAADRLLEAMSLLRQNLPPDVVAQLSLLKLVTQLSKA